MTKRLGSVAFLVFFAAAAGTGVVATHLVVHVTRRGDGLRGALRLLILLPAGVGQDRVLGAEAEGCCGLTAAAHARSDVGDVALGLLDDTLLLLRPSDLHVVDI